MGRTLFGILAGVIVMWLTIMLTEFASNVIYPPPTGFNPQQLEDLQAIIAAAPTGAMAIVVFGWAVGSFTGGWVAARIARRQPRIAATAIALMVMAFVATMVALVPQHPTWVIVLGLLLPLPIALFAATLASKRALTLPS